MMSLPREWLRELRLRALALLIANYDSAAPQEICQSVWFEGALETKTRYDILS